jgi:hypothetical protein
MGRTGAAWLETAPRCAARLWINMGKARNRVTKIRGAPPGWDGAPVARREESCAPLAPFTHGGMEGRLRTRTTQRAAARLDQNSLGLWLRATVSRTGDPCRRIPEGYGPHDHGRQAADAASATT